MQKSLRQTCRTFAAMPFMLLVSMISVWIEDVSIASDGDPVAIRYWPGDGTSIESMWNFHVALGVDAENRTAMPRTADVEFLDDFWEATGSEQLVLDRKPNAPKAVLKPAIECPDPSENAIRFSRIVLKDSVSGKSVYLNRIALDGVVIVDANKATVTELVGMLKVLRDVPEAMRSIDALLIEDATADPSKYQQLLTLLKPRLMVLRDSVKFDKLGETPVIRTSHNTLAISQSEGASVSKCIALTESAWTMQMSLAELFQKKEVACRASRSVFAGLAVNQMNFKPSNGTHTPRWNAEHMMGRELLFFSQIYHAVDSSIPVMDLNPKQMPPDYRPAHADWTGLEESLQMERVEAFTRRFAYLLEGMDLDATAKGSSFWTPRALLKQMEAHYTDHTANVVKKKSLSDWPKE